MGLENKYETWELNCGGAWTENDAGSHVSGWYVEFIKGKIICCMERPEWFIEESNWESKGSIIIVFLCTGS